MNERDLFVDDVRVLPNKALRINIPCDIARNFNEAMYFIEFQEYDFVSLDYSMDGETGLDVLKLMKQLNRKPKHINVHSDHSIGVPLMERYIKENFPDTILSFNRV